MNKFKCLIIILFVFSSVLFSQENGQVIGTISDTKTGEPIPGVNILVANANIGASSDAEGNFEIEGIPVGKHTLKFSFIGYKTLTQEVTIAKDQTTDVQVKLTRTTFNMDQVVITGTRYETAAKNIPLSVSVISAKNLEMKHVRSIDDALRNTYGLVFHRSQGLGTTTSHAGVQMRGTGAANRTLVMKDGIPINNSNTGSVSLWSTTAVNSIDKIEVIRGAGSAIYGSNAMGGIINMISASPTPVWNAGAHVEYGSFGTTNTGFKLGKAFEKIGFFFSGEYKSFDGYEYMKDDQWKDYYIKPQNEFLNLNGKLEYKITPTSVLSLTAEHHSEQPLKATSTQYDMDSKQNNFTAKYFRLSDFISYSAAIFYNKKDYTSNAVKYNSTTGKYDKAYYDSDLPETQVGFVGWITASLQSLLSDQINHKLTVGADGKQSSNESLYSYTAGDRFYEGEQHLYSGFINDEISIGESWNVSLGLRYDWWQNEGGNFYDQTGTEEVVVKYPDGDESRFSPKLGVVYHINQNSRLRASYGTGFKTPGVYYLYRTASHGSNFQVGNPDLKPEIMNLSIDVGADFTFFNMLEASLTYYTSSFEDFIYSKTLTGYEIPSYIEPEEDQGVIQYTNIGEVDIYGVELGFKLPFSNYWVATLNYDYNKSEIKEHEFEEELVGKELEDNPNNIVNVGLQYNNPDLFTIGIWLRNTGEQYSDDVNTNKIDGYSVLDIKLHREIYAGISASLSVYNALDEEYYSSYSSAKSYSLGVPRTVQVGISYNY
ncbi:MAG: TonB-dependent receptor [Ignavibacteria bacterium]|jgi:iron complex outermembrane receptor protein